ncbi:hypothetical protein PRIPAC_81193, partial [Pristionchus pacificus]
IEMLSLLSRFLPFSTRTTAVRFITTHCEMADPSSFSNHLNVVIRSTKLDWKVDMAAKTIAGRVDHEVEGITEDSKEIILDARDLTVEKVLWKGVEIPFNYEKVNPALGDRLSMAIPALSKGDRATLSISYRTSPSARALQFLTPAQTSDKKGPFLFSQCQAIHARSIVPCQDTPAVKAPYTSKVSVPAGLTCLMSAISAGSDTAAGKEQWVFQFDQSIPVPSYLIAIVVGVLEQREIGPRSAVWAEPSVVEKSAKEFVETEQFIKAAEEICGEYVWKRYDLVVLPSTFPYGGMENPCLTFVTPTIITGDRSLVSVVAHEIAHSWTGNLVTTANWDHFWLNEGFTVYLERKIIEKVYGTARRYFDAREGWDSLPETLKQVIPEHSKLRQNLGGVDPDDAFSSIPYEKGSSLLLWLEQEVLSEDETRAFLRDHVNLFSQKALDTETWLASMLARYPKMKDREAVVNEWLYGEGMPPKQPKFVDESLIVECVAVVADLLSSATPSAARFAALDSSQKVFVMNALAEKAPLDVAKLELLAAPAFGIATTHNCELLCPWIKAGMESKWEPIIPVALEFAKTYGRLKFCKKTYSLLFAWDASRQLAKDQFEREKPNMHPITVQQVEALLNKYK